MECQTLLHPHQRMVEWSSLRYQRGSPHWTPLSSWIQWVTHPTHTPRPTLPAPSHIPNSSSLREEMSIVENPFSDNPIITQFCHVVSINGKLVCIGVIIFLNFITYFWCYLFCVYRTHSFTPPKHLPTPLVILALVLTHPPHPSTPLTTKFYTL